MSLTAEKRAIGYYVMRILGVATYIPYSVASGASSMRVLNPEMFEPAGGSVIIESTDEVVTYESIQDDSLSGIPASGNGAITSTVNEYSHASASLLFTPNLVTNTEVEDALDRTRISRTLDCMPDTDKKIYKAPIGWMSTGVELRADKYKGTTALTPDTSNYIHGEFIFNSARSEDKLHAVGYFYDPFLAIAELLETLILDERWARYIATGQLVRAGKDANEISKIYMEKGKRLMEMIVT